jgi:hypothetical protein
MRKPATEACARVHFHEEIQSLQNAVLCPAFREIQGLQNDILCFAFDPVPRSVRQHMALAETVKIFFSR